MGCTINNNLELRENISLMWGHTSESEFLQMFVDQCPEKREENREIFLDEEKRAWVDEWNFIQGFIHTSDLWPTLQEFMGTKDKSRCLGYCGINRIYRDRLGFSFIEAWMTFSESPKLCVYIYPDSKGNIKTFLPMRGNTINPKTGKAIGWDVGYNFDARLWARDYEEDYNFLTQELLRGGDETFEEWDLYFIVHGGILQPNWEACRSEFLAYAVYDF